MRKNVDETLDILADIDAELGMATPNYNKIARLAASALKQIDEIGMKATSMRISGSVPVLPISALKALGEMEMVPVIVIEEADCQDPHCEYHGSHLQN